MDVEYVINNLLNDIIKEGKSVAKEVEKINDEIDKILRHKETETKYLQATIKISTYEKQVEELRKQINQIEETEKAYIENKKAIDENNIIISKINTLQIDTINKTNTINTNIYIIAQRQHEIETLNKEEFEQQYGISSFKTGMGAEAIKELLMAVDLEKEARVPVKPTFFPEK
mgnify:CR=1 FL=1